MDAVQFLNFFSVLASWSLQLSFLLAETSSYATVCSTESVQMDMVNMQTFLCGQIVMFRHAMATPDFTLVCFSSATITFKIHDISSSVASPKCFWGENILTLSEQQYFVWDTASQSTK